MSPTNKNIILYKVKLKLITAITNKKIKKLYPFFAQNFIFTACSDIDSFLIFEYFLKHDLQ
ncbi:MAG: hypothetical protein ACTSQS_09725 [Promethearchaeota archaeon]